MERYLDLEEVIGLSSTAWARPEGSPYPATDPGGAEAAAIRLRAAWSLGLDPLPNLAEFLEEQDIKVISAASAAEPRYPAAVTAPRVVQ